jgi:hypothetical protein
MPARDVSPDVAAPADKVPPPAADKPADDKTAAPAKQ